MPVVLLMMIYAVMETIIDPLSSKMCDDNKMYTYMDALRMILGIRELDVLEDCLNFFNGDGPRNLRIMLIIRQGGRNE